MGMPSNQDIVKDVAEGATKGVLEWSEEKIKQLIKKFGDKTLYFTEDPETIKLVKEQRKTDEWRIFKSYIKDEDSRILFQMGLTLRRLEREGKDFEPLRQKIIKKYKGEGLHIAQFVQSGLLNKYLADVLETGSSPQEVKAEIEDLFKNIDNRVVFIKHEDKAKQKIGEVVDKINTHSPKTFIIFSAGTAIKVCEKIKEGVMPKISRNYSFERYESGKEKVEKRIYFLNKTEEVL